MVNTVEHIKKLRKDLKELDKFLDKKGQISPSLNFTVDVSIGGNKHHSFSRISIGSVTGSDNSGEHFYKLLRNSIEASLLFWERSAKQDLKELENILGISL